MTVSSEVSSSGPYDGNGVTTVFPYGFKIVDETHLRVVLRDASDVSTDLSLNDGDYTVSGVGNDAGGNVTVTVPPATGEFLTILRAPPFTQETDLANQGPYSAEVVETRFDLTVMQIQSVKEAVGRAFTVSPGQTPPSLDLIESAVENAEDAAQSATDAAASAALASQFANANEDVQVLPGLYSAKHWMLKAQAIYNAIANTLAGWIHAAAAKTALAGADEFGIADSAAAFGLKKVTFADLQASLAGPVGQCRLVKSGANIVLQPKDGNLLRVAGRLCTIPAAGVSLAPTGLAVGSVLNIYATESGGVVNALEASATAHATDTTAGNIGTEIKSGDPTRTLVGMVQCIAGPAFQDSINQRFVRSWFNRKPEAVRKAFTANRSTASPTTTEVNPEIRCEWLQWADEVPIAAIQGASANNTANVPVLTSIGWDGVSDADSFHANASATGLFYNCSTASAKAGLAEGYHYATIMGSAPGGGTATWAAGTGVGGTFTSLSVRI